MTLRTFWNSTWFRFTLGTLISALFLYLAIKDVPLDEVARALARVHLAWVALAIALAIAQSFLRATRWIQLYHPLQRGLRVWQMFEIVIISQMLNIVAPWRIGELARIYLAGEIEKRSKTQTLATLGIEKIFDTTMLLLLLIGIPFFMTLPVWLERSREGLIIASIALFIGAFALIVLRERLIALLGKISLPWTRRSLDAHAQIALDSLDVLKRWDLHLALQAQSFVIWLIGVAINYCAFRALDLQLPFIAPFLLLAVLQVGGFVPSSPGKVGVFQALCIAGLALFGIDKSIGLTYGILLYLIAYGTPVSLGIWFLWRTGLSLRRVVTGASA
ncbi:MAG: flippase-like domain-containing protein [Chloroflexi bacterium]|nr:flippase-like domain-containing protein [Chloroflexota bacterium]